jgi:hypothetical protein
MKYKILALCVCMVFSGCTGLGGTDGGKVISEYTTHDPNGEVVVSQSEVTHTQLSSVADTTCGNKTGTSTEVSESKLNDIKSKLNELPSHTPDNTSAPSGTYIQCPSSGYAVVYLAIYSGS